MANYNLTVETLTNLLREAALKDDHLFSWEWQAQYILDKLDQSNGAHTNLADITSQKIAEMKREERSGNGDRIPCASCKDEPFPGWKDESERRTTTVKDYDSDGMEGERYLDNWPALKNAGSSFYGE